MKATAKLGLLCTLGMLLCGSGYEVASQPTGNQQDPIICLKVHSNDALKSVKQDLIESLHPEMSGKQLITMNSLLFHGDEIKREGTKFLIPFTLNDRGSQIHFQAIVKCSDLNNIEYDKL
ncbi:hypothetical protein [Pantoea rwandensis]|uniref:Uncharacterized protein n=1 Tax=Pantoea rwandensis TaxID=1076550 RepID=A0A1X1D012_9GAMM|nr:hypothetical protein [Pantoea rwandensis]ORM69964.1 hypothetical protein HA51_08505 [Pantoea rwandensis]